MKKQSTDKNVTAPEQKVKGISEIIADYLTDLGFTHYGTAGQGLVFTKPVFDALPSDLFVLVHGPFVRIYLGIKEQVQIRARKLLLCTATELEEAIESLKKQRFL
ncbi:MAG: hypothetical protein P4L51_23800 [Puia sp.]|nr:hypothetical protein [Puia sp.]